MGAATIFNGAFIKALKDQFKLGETAYVLTGTDDPTSVAKDAPKGSLYLRQTAAGSGQAFVKTDDGSSTNWTDMGAAGGSIAVEEEGSGLGSFTTLNFVGGTVTATDAGGGQADITISGSSTGSTDPIELLLQHGQISNSAFANGLSVGENSTNTESGFTREKQTNKDLRGVIVANTDLVGEIRSLGTGDVDVVDDRDKSASFLLNDVVMVFRKQDLDGVTKLIYTGIDKTLTGNSSFSGGLLTIPLDETSLQVGDALYKKNQFTHDLSYVDIGAADSFSPMTLESVEVTNFAGEAILDVVHRWSFNQTTGTIVDQVGTGNLQITGTISTTTDHRGIANNAATNMNSSNYIRDANFGGTSNIMSNNWQQTWSCSCWFWHNDAPGGEHDFFGGGSGSGWHYSNDGPSQDRVSFWNTGGGKTDFNITTGRSVVGQWNHVFVSHQNNGGNSRWNAWVNGVQRVTNWQPGGLIGNPGSGQGYFAINRGSANAAPFQNDTGNRYAQCFFLNRLVTQSDVDFVYNGGAGTSLDGATNVDTVERFTATGTGQVIKSKVTTPVVAGTSTVTVSSHGVILGG